MQATIPPDSSQAPLILQTASCCPLSQQKLQQSQTILQNGAGDRAIDRRTRANFLGMHLGDVSFVLQGSRQTSRG